MALVELSMLEQRYLAVREVLDTGATVTDVAARHGVDRRTLHRWLVRYANEGIGALAQHGYLLRVPDSADGRARVIRLTSKGRRLEQTIYAEAGARPSCGSRRSWGRGASPSCTAPSNC